MDRARVANGQRGPVRRGVQAPPDASAPARRESFREHRVKIPAATSGHKIHCDAPFFMRASACRNCKTRRPAKLKRASEAKKGGSECTHSAPTALDGRRCIVVTGRALKVRVVPTGPAPGPSTPCHGDFRHLMLIRALAVNPRDLGKEGPVSGVCVERPDHPVVLCRPSRAGPLRMICAVTGAARWCASS